MRKLIILTIWIVTNSTAFCQSAEDFIAGGRSLLVVSNIQAANNLFNAAVALEPSNHEANALLAVTRLLVLPTQPGGSNLLTTFGFPAPGRTIYDWTAFPTNDTNGLPITDPDARTSDAIGYLKDIALPAANASIQNLSRITDPGFTLYLSQDETKISGVTVDHGDILILKSFLHAIQFTSHLLDAHDLDSKVSSIKAMLVGEVAMEDFMSQHPSLLTFSNLNELIVARTAFRTAVDTYLTGSEFVRNRPTNVIRLFNLDLDSAEDERRFREAMGSLKASLDSAAVLVTETNYVVNLGAYFTAATSFRQMMPTFRRDSLVLGTLKDLTFGNTIFGVTKVEAERYLARYFPTISNLTSPRKGTNMFHFDLHGLEDMGYVIQMSTNLVAWSDVETITVPGGVVVVQDTTEPGLRFYRAVDLSQFISIQGEVLDYATGNPIAGATVSTSLDSTTASSDANGKFFIATRIPAVPENEYYTIGITANGYGFSQETTWWGGQVRGHRFYLASSPENDHFSNRSVLFSGASGTTIGATKEIGEPYHWLNTGGKSIWWSWKSMSQGQVSISTAGSTFDTVMSVYTGDSLQSLSRIAMDDDSGSGVTSLVQFMAMAGQTYQIAIDGYGGASGVVHVNVSR